MVDLIAITGGAAILIAILLWLIFRLNSPKSPSQREKETNQDPYNLQAAEAVKTIFNDEFREELRNRGRLYFEKIINENAMFLQQDLRLTTAQLNEYMKDQITKKLQEEFSKYEQSITDAKQLALDSISKTQNIIEEQRNALSKEVKDELTKNKEQLIKNFEEHMSDIVNHYVLAAIGDQIDLSDQLEFILNDLEANKHAIIEDIRDGA
jgi:hypothetical protein